MIKHFVDINKSWNSISSNYLNAYRAKTLSARLNTKIFVEQSIKRYGSTRINSRRCCCRRDGNKDDWRANVQKLWTWTECVNSLFFSPILHAQKQQLPWTTTISKCHVFIEQSTLLGERTKNNQLMPYPRGVEPRPYRFWSWVDIRFLSLSLGKSRFAKGVKWTGDTVTLPLTSFIKAHSFLFYRILVSFGERITSADCGHITL